MTSFITLNRYKIKKYLNNLFDLTSQCKFLEMHDVINLIEAEIHKYSILMDLDFERFEKALVDIRYDLGHYTRSDWRQEALRKHIKDIHDLLVEHEQNLTLYDRIVLLSESLDHNLSLLFSAEEAPLRDDVISDFENLQSLAPEIKNCGFEIYAAYRLVMKQAFSVKPYLPISSPDLDEKGRILVKPGEIKDLRSRTAPFLSSLADLLATFHQPSARPKPKEEKGKRGEDKKEEKKSLVGSVDIDELRRHQLFLESADLVTRQGWTWMDTARHLNLTSSELMDIWELEEIPEKDEDADETDEEEKPDEEPEKKESEKPEAKSEKKEETKPDDAVALNAEEKVKNE